MAVGDTLRRLVYRIEADSDVRAGLSGAEAETEAWTKAVSAQKAVIKVQGDLSNLNDDLKEARLQLKRLEKERTNVPVGMDTAEFDREINIVRAEIASLRRRKAEIKVDLDSKGHAYQAARRLTTQVREMNTEVDKAEGLFERWGKRITGTRVNLGPFTTNLRTLMGVLVVMGPVISGVVGAITALSGSLVQATAGALAIGAAGFAGLALSATGAITALAPLKNSFKEVSTAQDALTTAQHKYGKSSEEAKNAQKQLDKVLASAPPHIQQVTSRWNALKASFTRRTGGIRDDAVSVMNDALRTGQKLLPAFARESEKTFHVASQGVHEWLEGLRSPEAERLLTKIMSNFRRGLPDLLHGLGQFATAFARISAAASDFLPEFTEGFDRVGTDFAESTENGKHLHRVMGDLTDQTHTWFRFLGATGRVLTTILVGGANSGQGMIEDFTDTLNEWNRALSGRKGQRNMQQFFSESATTTKQFLGLLRRVLTVLFQLSRATEPFAQGFLEVANAVGDIVSLMAKIAPLRDLMVGLGVAMTGIWLVNRVTRWYDAAVAALTRVGLMAKTEGATAGATFARSMGIGLATFGLFNIASSAIEGDAKDAGFKAGGALVGGLLGALGGPAGAMLGVGIGSMLGGALGGLFGKTDQVRGAMAKLRDTTRSSTDAFRANRKAMQTLARGGEELDRSRHRSKRTSERLHAAERHLSRVRKTAPADSRRVARAEERVARAKIADRRATKGLERAEELHGQERKIARRQARLSLADLRENNRSLKQQVRTLGHHFIALSNDTSKTAQARRAGEKLDRVQGKLRDNQQKINRVLRDAATNISPKFSKSLQDASLRVLQIGRTSNRTERWMKFGFDAQLADTADTAKNKLTRTLNQDLTPAFLRVGDKSGVAARDIDASGRRSETSTRTHSRNTIQHLDNLIDKYTSGLQKGGGVKKQKGGDVDRKQSGGFTVPGSGDGDKFHTLLPPGAFVLNRNASAAVGFQSGGAVHTALEPGERVFMPREAKQLGGLLPALNNTISRFAKGGVIEQALGPYSIPPIEYDANHAGGNSHLHLDFQNQQQAIAYGKKMQRMGWAIGEYSGPYGGFGGLSVSHQSPGHYDGTAFDANTSADETRSQVAKVASLLGGAGVATARIKLARFLATRPATRGNAGGLNLMAEAMERWGNKKIRPTGGGTMFGSGAMSRGQMRKLLNANSLPDIMGWVAGAETGWDASLVNSIGATGLFQILVSAHPDLAAKYNLLNAGENTAAAATLYRANGLSDWEASRNQGGLPSGNGGWGQMQGRPFQAGGFVGMKTGGAVPAKGLPGHMKLRLPPKPKQRRKSDFSTEPGSWYDWYGRAIDFFDTRGDTRNERGKPVAAKGDWNEALRDIIRQRQQVHRIIDHDKQQIRRIRKKDLPDRLRKAGKRLRQREPSKHFHFRDRKKGESNKEFHKEKRQARSAWKDRRKEWEREKRAHKQAIKEWEKQNRQRRQSIKSELPDLFQQLRVDLPTRYNEIREKITGQREDIQLQQTAFGQERFQAFQEFGGNFSAQGFGVGSNPNRHGTQARHFTGGGGRLGAQGFGVRAPSGAGARAAMSAASGGGGGTSVNKTVNVVNNYKTQPSDPHTWSASVRHELGALT